MNDTDQAVPAAMNLPICRGMLYELPKHWRIEFILQDCTFFCP